ncbi:MAG: cation:dicarboxylase symporter family transporter [Planctomycetota bacterium]
MNSETAPVSEPKLISGNRSWWQWWTEHQGVLVVGGLVAGIATGAFFGPYSSFLSVVGDAFVGLLRMTVLPFIATSLIASLGRQSIRQTRYFALVGGVVLVALWTLTLTTVVLLPSTLPPTESGSFFSSALVDPVTGNDLLSSFIPSNIFAALAGNDVPAIILFCVCTGTALSTVPRHESLVSLLDTIANVLLKVAGFIARLAPIGVFAISASVAGTTSLQELRSLQGYLVIYCTGCAFLAFVALPLMVVLFTPLRYRQVLRIIREPMITAFVTGKLIIVLPMLIENTERLIKDQEPSGPDAVNVEVLYATAYAFPHAGKLLSMVFIPFAAWFLGGDLAIAEYPPLLASGVAVYFGGPILAIPYLLDVTQLPHDMFQLFLLTGVIGERVGDSVGVVHLTTFSLLTLTAMRGSAQLSFIAVTKYLATLLVVGTVTLVCTSIVLSYSIGMVESRSEVLAKMQLIEEPTDSVLISQPVPNPDPLKPGETIIQRIRRRGVLRVGYNEDKLPFAYFGESDNLIGFDVNLAHALAHDLGVSLEFVRFDRATVAGQLESDHFDMVMSGLVGTLERSEVMQHSASYMDVNLGLVVPDYRVREFKSLKDIRKIDNLKIGFVDLSSGFVSRLTKELPDAQLIEILNNRDYFESPDLSLDALLISAESGSAYTLLYPSFEVAMPEGLKVQLPLIYAIGGNDVETRDFVNYWVELRTKDGTFKEYYEHWILGKTKK